MQRILSVVLGLTIVAGFATGCATQRIKAEKAVARTLISDEQEEQLGAQVKQQLEQEEKIQYVQDAAVTQYVNSVATPILRAANKDRSGVKWQVFVINDPKTVNAFATPGGYLYVYTGLILAADNEAELAGVLAHEAGHVVGRHSARAMVNAYGLQALSELALGKNPGAQLAHGRSEETEADEYGARYTASTGYDPRGLITFFDKLRQQEGTTPGVLKWLSTHPTSADRITHLQQFISQNRLSGSNLGADRIAPIKQRLKSP
jgi:beta-barrel assembly-enhancing protease